MLDFARSLYVYLLQLPQGWRPFGYTLFTFSFEGHGAAASVVVETEVSRLNRTIAAFLGIPYQEPGTYALASRREPGSLYCFVDDERKCLVLFSDTVKTGEFMGARSMSRDEWVPVFFPLEKVPELLKSYEDAGVLHVTEDPPTDPFTGFYSRPIVPVRTATEETLSR